jgi:hypothetical protein
MSAFCIIVGLNLADAKFKAFMSIFGAGLQLKMAGWNRW